MFETLLAEEFALLAWQRAEYDVMEAYEEYMFDGIANVRMATEWLTESARRETAPRDSELVMQYWRPEKNPL